MGSQLVYLVSTDHFLVGKVAEAVSLNDLGTCSTFETGQGLTSSLERDSAAMATVIVDSTVEDVSALNLVAAVVSRRPDVGVIAVLDTSDPNVIDRAMLAGARAVVDRSRIQVDLVPAIQRVAVGAARFSGSLGRAAQAIDDEPAGRVVVIAGAKGGAGRTFISTMMALLAARAGVDCALVDLDLQWGDLGFVFDAPVQSGLLDMATRGDDSGSVRDFAVTLESGLHLFAAPATPEQAEVIAPRISSLMRRLRRSYSLIIVNTGAFWTLLHAEVLDNADLAVMVMDQQASAVRATVQARDLCHRLGIPDAKLVYVMNGFEPKRAVTPQDAAVALQVPDVQVIPDDGPRPGEYLDAGKPAAYLEQKSAALDAITALLSGIVARLGIELTEQQVAASSAAKRRRW